MDFFKSLYLVAAILLIARFADNHSEDQAKKASRALASQNVVEVGKVHFKK